MEKVYEFILTKLNISYGDTVVVAVSAGPDSMSLLHILTKVKKALDIEIICAHVNHNIRKESLEEKKVVERFCLKNNVIFKSMTISNYGDDNFHNEARNKRYSYFVSLSNQYKSKYIFTAHHGDDLIETILMRIVRGSTLKGYSGFSKLVQIGNKTIVRPLINVTKQEILEYNKKNKVEYVEDLSNTKDVYTRNRYRKYIVPEFKKEDKNVHNKFYKFSTTLLEYNDYIDRQVNKIIKKIYNENTINIEEFLKQENLIQNKILNFILEEVYLDDLMLINDTHVSLIKKLIKSSKANAVIYLPNNYKIVKAYNICYFLLEDVENQEYEIEIIDYVNLPNAKNIEKISKSKNDDNNICRLLSSEIKLPLRVRTKKNGDKMSVKGMLGRKKVNDILTDCKIPTQERNSWPIVVDSQDNIVWMPGLKKSKFNKLKGEFCDIILKYY